MKVNSSSFLTLAQMCRVSASLPLSPRIQVSFPSPAGGEGGESPPFPFPSFLFISSLRPSLARETPSSALSCLCEAPLLPLPTLNITMQRRRNSRGDRPSHRGRTAGPTQPNFTACAQHPPENFRKYSSICSQDLLFSCFLSLAFTPGKNRWKMLRIPRRIN